MILMKVLIFIHTFLSFLFPPFQHHPPITRISPTRIDIALPTTKATCDQVGGKYNRISYHCSNIDF